MSEISTFNYNAAALLLPPTSLLLLALLGVLLATRKRRAPGLVLCAASLLALLALATPAVAYRIARALEPPALPNSRAAADVQAIVILAGGISRAAPDWGGETLTVTSLQRVRYGARLARELRLPVLVSGGNPTGGSPEGAVMKEVLQDEFNVPVRWLDDRSNTTAENAVNSARLLQAAGVQRIALVTSAMHMPRALLVFRATGLQVVPAPTGYFGQAGFHTGQLIPSGEALRVSFLALREWLGLGWYHLRH
jgi:uncharacterized SAM-binding protein YcdF (DUF218 family)